MPSIPLNNNQNIKNKNINTRLLIDELKQINEGKIKNADIDLTKTTIKQAIRLVKQNIADKRLAIKLDDDRLYMLNENTINKLEKGLVDENANVNTTEISGSDEEVKSILGKIKNITLKVIEPEPDKDKRRRIAGKTKLRQTGLHAQASEDPAPQNLDS